MPKTYFSCFAEINVTTNITSQTKTRVQFFLSHPKGHLEKYHWLVPLVLMPKTKILPYQSQKWSLGKSNFFLSFFFFSFYLSFFLSFFLSVCLICLSSLPSFFLSFFLSVFLFFLSLFLSFFFPFCLFCLSSLPSSLAI